MAVVVIGRFRVPRANMQAILPLMRKVVETSRTEAGCIEYNYAEDALEPGLVRVSEVWESRECLDAHLASRHMDDWRREREALGMHDRKLMAYAVEGWEAL